MSKTKLTAEQQAIVTDNISLVYGAAKHFNSQNDICKILRIEWDDYISVLYIALCKAVKSYDASRGAALITLFWTVAEHDISHIFTAASRHCRRANYEAYSLDYITDGAGDTLGAIISDEDAFRNEDDILTRIALLDVIKRLPEMEREVILAYHVDQIKQRELGAKYGISHARISQILQAAQKRLKKELGAI